MRSIRCIAIRVRKVWLNKTPLDRNILIGNLAISFQLLFVVNDQYGYERTRQVQCIGPHG